MRVVRALLASFLILVCTLPTRADFEYTETSQVTGGALVGMLKFASVFARGDAKKQERQALAPASTTHYIKGGRIRTDQPDGTIQIIDLDGRRVIYIDPQNKAYAVATFDQIKTEIEQARQNMQQQMQQNPQEARELQNAQLTITPTVTVTPGTGNRIILNQPTNESKVQVDMTMQATTTDPAMQSAAASSGQPASATATYVMNMDTFVAPTVTGYLEFAGFYRRMAKEVSWMTLPSTIHVDPRVSQGLSQLQQNSDALKGFPLLSYVSMTLALPPGTSQSGAQSQQQASNPPPSNTGNSSAGSSIPDSPSGALMKGLGGLFNRKKQQDNSSQSNQGSTNSGGSASQTNAPPHNPNALIEITTQVNSFSDQSLDRSLFDIPAGYAQIQQDPAQILNGAESPKARSQR